MIIFKILIKNPAFYVIALATCLGNFFIESTLSSKWRKWKKILIKNSSFYIIVLAICLCDFSLGTTRIDFPVSLLAFTEEVRFQRNRRGSNFLVKWNSRQNLVFSRMKYGKEEYLAIFHMQKPVHVSRISTRRLILRRGIRSAGCSGKFTKVEARTRTLANLAYECTHKFQIILSVPRLSNLNCPTISLSSFLFFPEIRPTLKK